MSSKLKKAENLLHNYNASDREMQIAVGELERVLKTQHREFDRTLQKRYAEIIVRLNLKINETKSIYENSEDIVSINVPKKENYFSNSSNYVLGDAVILKTRISSGVIHAPGSLEADVSLNSIEHFSKLEFMPEEITAGMHIWTNYANVNYVKDTPKIKVMKTQKAEFILAKEIPQGWIGDFMVVSAKSEKNHPVLEVEPIIYLEKVKKLFEFYSQESYLPWNKGEFFWTKVPPTKIDFKPTDKSFSYSDGKDSAPKNKKLCEYKTEVKGLLMFLERFSDEDARRLEESKANVFDFIFRGYAYNRNSGKAIFVQNSPRATVIANMDKYLLMEK